MVYLVKMKVSYRTFYFKFDDIETALNFCLKMKSGFIGEISDDSDLKVSIDVLETYEYEEMIKEDE
jgi:hypothetical protein